jgi:hypothetical protein
VAVTNFCSEKYCAKMGDIQKKKKKKKKEKKKC